MRFLFRSFLKNPGFPLLAVLSLAAGAGLTTALLSIADAILLRPLPVPRPSEIRRIFTASQDQTLGYVSYPDFEDFSHSPPIRGAVAQTQVLLALGDPPRVAMGLAVTANYFDLLQIHAALGRTFRSSESRDPVVVLAWSFWQSRFGADPAILGRILPIAGASFQIIGVAPEYFGLDRFTHEQFYVPMGVYQAGLLPSTGQPLEDRSKRFLSVYVRATDQARAEIPVIARQLEREYPSSNRGRRALVLTELEARLRSDRTMPALTGLLAAVAALVALIAGANLACLVMLRREARSREIAIKIALGATPFRLLRESLLESALLSAIGAVIGSALAFFAVRLLASFATLPTDMPFAIHPRIDLRIVLAFAFITTLVSLVPSANPRNSKRWRSAVAVTEIALAAATTILGGFLLQNIFAASHLHLGYRTDHVLVLALDPAQIRYDETRTKAFYRQLLDRVRQIPGIRQAALAQSIPLGYTGAQRLIEIDGDQRPGDREGLACWMNLVTPEYFALIHMPILAGRPFDHRDTAQSPPVAIVNDALAKRFPASPLGRTMRVNGRPVEIVGIVRTSKYFNLGESPRPFFYMPYSQNFASRMILHVKTSSDPASAAPAIVGAIRSLDPSQPISEIRSLDDYFSRGAMFAARLGVRVLAAVAACALLLAMAGLYGVLAQTVARRNREIGIRMALGAPRSHVIFIFGAHATGLALIGIAAGSLAAWRAAPFLSATPKPWIFLAALILILAASLAACLPPAARACRIDPSITLREP